MALARKHLPCVCVHNPPNMPWQRLSEDLGTGCCNLVIAANAERETYDCLVASGLVRMQSSTVCVLESATVSILLRVALARSTCLAEAML